MGLLKTIKRKARNVFFPGSVNYWEKRYKNKGNSGAGSYGKKAAYKAAFLNRFVAEHSIQKVTEFGCGDGNQLKQLHFPFYVGLDVAPTVVVKCKELFKADNTKQFFLYDQQTIKGVRAVFSADLVLSLDVIYHLVEDDVFEKYMCDLFATSAKYVIIYAWNVEEETKYHVRHRRFSKWIKEFIPNFALKEKIPGNAENNFCEFFVYEKLKLM